MSNKVFQQNLDDKKGPQPGGISQSSRTANARCS